MTHMNFRRALFDQVSNSDGTVSLDESSGYLWHENTTYAVVLTPIDLDRHEWGVTSSGGEDMGFVAPWSIADDSRRWVSGAWSGSFDPLRIAIRGFAGDRQGPKLSISDAEAVEGDLMTFTVTLSEVVAEQVSVKWSANALTSPGPEDERATHLEFGPPRSGMLTFPPGTTTQTIMLPTTEDLIAENDEIFGVSITEPVNALLFKLIGFGTIRNDDWTLSALAVNDGSTDLTLTPPFGPGTHAYDASVANTVAEVTVMPTQNDSGATIEYLDASDMMLADAGTAAGHQVTLAVGDNVIKVKVTPADGTITQTYTVTVNRAAVLPPFMPTSCTLNPGDVWCGTVTVGKVAESNGKTIGHGFHETWHGAGVGYMHDGGIVSGANSYRIDEAMVGVGATDQFDGFLFFSLNRAFTTADRARLVLHVGSARFPLSEAHFESSTHTYHWRNTGLDWSSESSVTLRLQAGPAAPTAVTATAPPRTGGLLEVEWTAPALAGSITGYEVKYWKAADPENENRRFRTARTESTEPSLLLYPFLDASTEYELRVRASSALGWGAWSETATARTGAKQSSKPIVSLSVIDANGADINQITAGETFRYRVKVRELLNHHQSSGKDFTGWGTLGVRGPISIEYFNSAGRYGCHGAMAFLKDYTWESSTTGYWDFDSVEIPASADSTGPMRLQMGFACTSSHSETSEVARVTRTSKSFALDDSRQTACLSVADSDGMVMHPCGAPASAAEPLTAAFEGLPEAHDGETAFTFRIAFSEAVSVTPEAMRTHVLEVAGGAVIGAARVDGASGVWAITVTPASREELSIALAPAADCAADGAVCTADGRALSSGAAAIVIGPGPETQTQPDLTAAFGGVPAAHDGERAFSFRVAFSEGIDVSYKTVRDASFTVTGGEVTQASRVDRRRDLWKITIEPDSNEAVTVRLPETTDCDASGAICTGDGRPLAHALSATVAGPADESGRNTAAAGAPTISGTPQVGEALTASTSGISDADGLDTARFAYQWIRTDTDIQGATGATYTPVAADEGERLTVRVSFTDDAGNAERLTSAATDAVAARPEPLTASFEGLPAEHAGQGSFSFRVAFSEGINISYKTVRDASFRVTGGDVTQASRVDGRRDLWKITVEPASDTAVTVRLPETSDCGASGAICTGDGRGLSHALSATVAGPVGVTVADARVEEGANAVLAFAVTLSRAASAALTVDYATADGSAHAGDDYTAASGTLTFRVGESTKTIEVAVLDDAHDEGEETLTLRLSNASGGRLADGEATGTIKNHDPMPRALVARFGRTAAVHVVEHVEERLAAPREPGFRGRFAGRELRRGMERDIALNVLRQLGGTAGAGPMGAGAGGPLSGAPAAARGMPGPAGGGGHLAASGSMGGAALMGGASGSMGMAAGPMGGAAGPDGRFDGGGLLRMGLGGGDVLTGSDFALGRETGHGGILSFWSRGAQSRFAGREGALSLGGDVRTTMFGADYATGPVVTGLSLSHSRGLGEYAGVAGGQVASSVTGLYPWLGYKRRPTASRSGAWLGTAPAGCC